MSLTFNNNVSLQFKNLGHLQKGKYRKLDIWKNIQLTKKSKKLRLVHFSSKQ